MLNKIILCGLLIVSQYVVSQNNEQAEKILTDLLTTAKTTAIRTNFRLTVTENKNAQVQTVNGIFTLKASKFVLEMDAMKAWFDGKTQWSYVPQNNEVSITEPSEKELTETNPMAILSGFKSKCKIQFSQKIKSEQNYCIEMIPKQKNDILKIDLQVNKLNGNLFSIKLSNKNGSSSTVLLTNFQKAFVVTDSYFSFNSAKYKSATINDLR